LYAQPIGDRQVVVIGDVPEATAERMARAVEPAPH
jgi:negative regulator of sigma E activity